MRIRITRISPMKTEIVVRISHILISDFDFFGNKRIQSPDGHGAFESQYIPTVLSRDYRLTLPDLIDRFGRNVQSVGQWPLFVDTFFLVFRSRPYRRIQKSGVARFVFIKHPNRKYAC